MDRFQQFLNDGWRPEQAPMKGVPKVSTIPGAYTSPTWRPGDTTRCVCPACDPDDEPGGDDLDGGYPARSKS